MSHFQNLQNSAINFPGVSCHYTMKQKLSKAALENTKYAPSQVKYYIQLPFSTVLFFIQTATEDNRHIRIINT